MNIVTSKKIIASMIIAIMLIGVTSPIFAATTNATVKTKTYIYSSESTGSTKKAEIYKEQTVKVSSINGNWCKVSWQVTAYAHKNFVNKNGEVKGGGPNLYSDQKHTKQIGDLKTGKLTILENKKLYDNNYYKVSVNVTGYMKKADLNIKTNTTSSTGSTASNKPTSSSSGSTTSILASLLQVTFQGAETGARLTFKFLSGLLGKLDGNSSSSTSTETNKNKLTLTKSNISMTKDETTTITAKFNGGEVKPNYTSSNTDVATVDKNGKITAIKKGTATITAQHKGSTASCTVTVNEKTQTSSSQQPTSSNGTITVYLTSYKPTEGNNENFALAKVGKVLKYDSNGKIGIVHPNVHRDKTMGWYVYEHQGKNYVIVGLGTKKDGSTNGLEAYQTIKFQYKGSWYDAVILDVGYGQKDVNYPTIDVFTCEDQAGVGKIKANVQITGNKIKPVTNFNNGKYQTILEY